MLGDRVLTVSILGREYLICYSLRILLMYGFVLRITAFSLNFGGFLGAVDGTPVRFP
jgi:hypothetical protein